MPKSFFITGGAGFIGSNIAQHCVAEGAKVAVYDNLHPLSGANRHNLKPLQGKIDFFQEDIMDLARLKECLAGYDVVVHCAALVSHGLSMREPYGNVDVNVKGTLNVLEAMRAVAPQAQLIYLGTTTQFGQVESGGADENSPEFAMDIYSAHKSLGEKYALIYGRHYGLKVTVARLSNVYGIRAAIHSPGLTFNNFFLGQALQGRTITVYGQGGQIRNIIHVDDVVSAVMAMVGVRVANGEVFLVAGDHHLSVLEIARTIVDVVGKGAISYVDWPKEALAAEVGDVYIRNDKCKRLLGWRPAVGWREGWEQMRDYYEENLQHYLR